MFRTKMFNVTKQVRFSKFTISIIDNYLCLLQHFKWNQNTIAAINHQCAIRIKFHDHS